VTAEDQEQLRAIERLLGQAVPHAQGSSASPGASSRTDGHAPRSEPERRRRRGGSSQVWSQTADGGSREANGEIKNGSDLGPVS
jgi:hypothetical protein